MDIYQIRDTWIEYLKSMSYSDYTIRGYTSDFDAFTDFIANQKGKKELSINNILQIELNDIRSFLATKVMKGTGARSNARALSSLRAFFVFYKERIDEKIDATHPIFDISTPKFLNKIPNVMSYDQIMDAISQTDIKTWVDHRNIAIMTLIYGTGMRIGEALSLNYEILPLSDLLVIKGKGGKERLIPILKNVKHVINNYINDCPYIDPKNKKSAIFYGERGKRLNIGVAEREIKKMAMKIGVNISPHDLRHAFATHLLSNGVNLKIIKDLLGHTSVETTKIYTSVDITHITKCHEKFHPRS